VAARSPNTSLAVAGPGEKLLLSRNAYKAVVAGVVVNGAEPIRVHPEFDTVRHLAHPPEPDDLRRKLGQHPDANGMLLITPTDWGTCADIARRGPGCARSTTSRSSWTRPGAPICPSIPPCRPGAWTPRPTWW
jgi:hypothetical protein